MALRNTLLVCAAIVASGAVAGILVRPGGYFQQSYDARSGAASPYGNASPGLSQGQPNTSTGSPDQTYGQSSPDDGDAQGDQSRPYPTADSQRYPRPQDQQGDTQQPYPTAGAQPYPRPQDQQDETPGYDQSQTDGAPSDRASQPNQAGLVPLTQVDQADRILPRMPVETDKGQRIGEVAQVLMHNGRAREVLLDEGTRIPASALMYSPSRSVLIAQASPRPSSY